MMVVQSGTNWDPAPHYKGGVRRWRAVGDRRANRCPFFMTQYRPGSYTYSPAKWPQEASESTWAGVRPDLDLIQCPKKFGTGGTPLAMCERARAVQHICRPSVNLYRAPEVVYRFCFIRGRAHSNPHF